MRILGLDFGSKTVGVAVSDPSGMIATGLEIIRREHETKLRKTYARIEAICEEYSVERIVLGLPLNMNGTQGDRVLKTKEFAENLERRTGLEIIFEDERLTTVEADDIMKELDIRRENRKDHVDRIAAAIILQTYLDSLN